ncbi:MAG: GGDEF domain-containing protein [Terracidiphilus sp.]
MKKLVIGIAILLGSATTAWSAPPAPLTKLRQITALANAEADRKLPVAFEATVTSYLKQNSTLYVQDDGVGIYVFPKTDAQLVAGDRVLVRGTTAGSFHPIVVSESITFLRHGSLPEAVPATFDDLIHFKYDCVLVKVRGVIRAADKQLYSKANGIDLKVLLDGGYFDVFVDYNTDDSLENLLDAEVEITGVAGGAFGGKMQVIGVMMVVPSPSLVRVIHRANNDPWSLPLTPMDQVITGYHITDRTKRVRVHGVVTYYQPNRSAVLQDGKKSLWIMTQTYQPMAIGDIVDATGFPEARNGFLTLSHGELRDSHVQAPIAPMPTTRKDLATSGHIIDLVSVEGIVVSEARGGTQDQYNLTADGQLFNAIYHHPTDNQLSLPMKQIPIGSKVRVTGICVTEDSNPFDPDVGFDILMRTFDDIEVIAGPSMVNIRNLTIAVGLLLVLVFFAIARSWAVERKVRHQTAALAATEQRRSRILVDINGSRPLAEIIEEITEFVSFQLGGAPCWCQITDGARLGKFSPGIGTQRIACEEIPSRSGLPHGEICVAFDKASKPSATEADTLSMTAGLAALAIETRRLYSDLHRRSEFDLLTDIHNRFALEKRLDMQIAEAHHKAGVFGLIYIDLDKFKPINDHYGHHIGDLYLQEVALRMKSQLRGADILARVGGDEFAALISEARSRDGVEEIAQRLERCFDQPFFIEGIRILGAASFGIAFYPEDGATKDELLNAADGTMYAVKNKKRPEAAKVA